jgi:hypothetical protein
VARRTYDRFLVHTKIGTNRKVRRLKVAERWCHVAGVLAIAAESPVPGHLLVAEGMPATERDYAEHAGVSPAVARRTLTALRELGIVAWDPQAGCEYVHDWDEWNTASRSDPTGAARAKAYRDRMRAEKERHGAVT